MLYREPRYSVVALFRAVVARLAAALAEFHRTGTDAAYLDSLNDHQLRDLGVSRFNDRSETFYR